MSIQKICKFILSKNKMNKSEFESLQQMAREHLKKISVYNSERYYDDIEKSRLNKKVNNSRQAIKKHYKNRKIKKNLILKHIEILKGLKNEIK